MPARSKLEGLHVPPLCTVEVPNLGPETTAEFPFLLEDCRYIGSYDWSPDATRATPAIIVPGEQIASQLTFYTSLVHYCELQDLPMSGSIQSLLSKSHQTKVI